MNTKEFEVIEVSKGLSVVVDKAIQPVTGNYYDTFISAVMNTGGAEYEKSRHTLQIIATIGQKLEGVPRVVVPNSDIDFIGEKEQAIGRGGEDYASGYVEGLKDGYDTAQSKGVYSEEDMRNALLKGLNYSGKEPLLYEFEFMQSLNHPKQIKSVVLEMDGDKPKLTTPDEIVPVEVRY